MVKLPEDDPNIFDLSWDLVYSGRLDTCTTRKYQYEIDALDEDTFKTQFGDEYHDLLTLYILAEKLQDIAAKNADITGVIDVSQVVLEDGMWTTPSLKAADIVYEGTPEGSPLRRFLVDMFSRFPLSYILRGVHQHSVHPDFVSDLAE